MDNDIIKEIVSDKGLNFKTAVIYADVDKSHVREKLQNEIKPRPCPELTKEALDQTNNIVGQMGHEPIVMALENGAQLLVGGL